MIIIFLLFLIAGSALMRIVEVYKEINEQENNIVSIFMD